MSVTVVRYLHCDECNEPWIVDPIAGEDIQRQRAAAKQDGWLVALPGGRDICTDCKRLADNESDDA